MKKLIMITALASFAILAGCATGQVKPSYVSPTQYQAWNCAQLHTEYTRINQYVSQGVEPEKRTGMGVGLGVGFGGGWGIRPNVSVNMGQSSNTKRTEIAKLFGQQDAIAQAAQFKNCPIQNLRK